MSSVFPPVVVADEKAPARPKVLRAAGAGLALLLPAAATGMLGFPELARYVALGTIFTVQIGVMARPAWTMSLYLPVFYALAAIASELPIATAAVLAAVAAIAGYSVRSGGHRGLVALVVIAVLGAFEPSDASMLPPRVAALFAGVGFGALLVHTLLRNVNRPAAPVSEPQAWSFAALLATLVVIAWFAARGDGPVHVWWLPIAVALACEPDFDSSAMRPLVRLASALLGAIALGALVDQLQGPELRIVVLAGLLVALLRLGPRDQLLFALLATPVVVLIAGDGAVVAAREAPVATLVAAVAVLFATLVGETVRRLARQRRLVERPPGR